MLKLKIVVEEIYDEETMTFVDSSENFEVELEHSLFTISKWEEKFEKPFLDDNKTPEDTLEYIKIMALDDTRDFTRYITYEQFEQIQDYISKKASATTFIDPPSNKTGGGNFITSELIYFWMINYKIPMEAERWHINRLFALIRIFTAKNDKSTNKMSKADIVKRNRELNEQRRRDLKSKG